MLIIEVYNPDVDAIRFLADVRFFVEADSYAYHMLWESEYYGSDKISSWEQISIGITRQVCTISSMPVHVTIFKAVIEGVPVAFYTSDSSLVHWPSVEKYIKSAIGGDWPKYDGTRSAHCNATNFHHCLKAIKEFNEKK